MGCGGDSNKLEAGCAMSSSSVSLSTRHATPHTVPTLTLRFTRVVCGSRALQVVTQMPIVFRTTAPTAYQDTLDSISSLLNWAEVLDLRSLWPKSHFADRLTLSAPLDATTSPVLSNYYRLTIWRARACVCSCAQPSCHLGCGVCACVSVPIGESKTRALPVCNFAAPESSSGCEQLAAGRNAHSVVHPLRCICANLIGCIPCAA